MTRFCDTLVEVYNNDGDCHGRRIVEEVRTAYENFMRACTRYTRIINDVVFENVFEPMRSTFEGLSYGKMG